MENKDQTLGQKRVKAEFNPAKNSKVDEIKNKGAELIDLLESMKTENPCIRCSGEKLRLIHIAQTEIETAVMYGVKSNFME